MDNAVARTKTILVVDDHPMVREALCEMISRRPEFRILGEASTQREARRLIQAEAPDLMILDLGLADGNAWKLIEHLHAEGRLPPTLVVSACDEAVYAPRLLKAGIRGYVMKDAPVGKIIEAIDNILAGHIAVSPSMATALINRAVGGSGLAEPSELDRLSDRELQVLEALGDGLDNRQIAEQLGVSPKTVGTYKARLMEKVGTRTSHELVDYARRVLT